MTSISWNDLNDSSQLSDASSDQGNYKKNNEKSKNSAPIGLQKTISSPQHSINPLRLDDSEKNGDKFTINYGTKQSYKKGIQKKYSQKYPEQKKEGYEQIKSPQNRNFEQVKSPRNKPKQYYQKQEQKKKIKYVAKDDLQKKNGDWVKKLQQISEKSESNYKDSSTVKPNSKDSQKSENKISNVQGIKSQTKQKTQEKKRNKSQASDQQDEVQTKQKQNEKSQPTKKNKPTKKKSSFVDVNNPFSSFAN